MENFKVKKKFGQNFLKDQNIIYKIVNSVDITSDDLVIEVGPGQGALTKELVKKNPNLLCFEIDEDTKPYLLPLENDKTKIIYGDFLNCDIKDIISNIKYQNLYVIANLPYYITSPIITKIIESGINPDKMILMVQKEVAERYSSLPGSKDYGQITVKLNYYFDIKTIIDVNRRCFYPAPNVDSAVIMLSKHELLSVDINKFNYLVEKAFKLKRKTLKNNLSKEEFDLVLPILLRNGYTDQVRAEAINLNTFIEMSNVLN